MDVRAGTSGYSYREWKGRFYPRTLPVSRMLSFYASRFGAVEINNTFYEMPTAETLAKWRAQVNPAFVFALKAPQVITHHRRLKACAVPTRRFLAAARVLEGQLGPVLFQLPPNFKKDTLTLGRFLARLPPGLRAAFEFRDPSWFDEETYALLRARDVALCVADDEALSTPFVCTASFGYLRLRRPGYRPRELAGWIERVRAAPWNEAFVFFKHEDEARGPALALHFATAFTEGAPTDGAAPPSDPASV